MTPSREEQFQRRERRVLRSYLVSEGALSECQFALDVDRQFEKTERHYVEAGVLAVGIRPKFKLEFNAERFTVEAQQPLQGVGVAIVARDLARRDYQVLQRFCSSDLPGSWQTPKPLSSSEGIDFQIIAYLTNFHPPAPGRAWRRGSVLAKAPFSVKAQVPNFTFPIVPADFPNDDLWRIRWQQEPDFNEPTESVLELQINTRVHDNLRLLLHGSEYGSVLTRMLAAQVFEVVARKVLEEHDFDSDNPNENGLASLVISKLQEVTGLSPESLRSQADDVDLLRSAAQRACVLVETINALTPRGV